MMIAIVIVGVLAILCWFVVGCAGCLSDWEIRSYLASGLFLIALFVLALAAATRSRPRCENNDHAHCERREPCPEQSEQ